MTVTPVQAMDERHRQQAEGSSLQQTISGPNFVSSLALLKYL
jgi:hypothetical protein